MNILSMLPLMRRPSSAPPGPGPGAWVAGALLLLGGLSTAAVAAGPPGEPAANHDLRHTMLARTALLKDPALAALNLGVRVHNRVAVLWGPVPSAALKERAARVLRQVPDLLEVRNELHVEAPPEPAPQYLPENLPPATPMPAALPGFSRAEEGWRDQFARRQEVARGFASPAENVRLRPAPPADERTDTAVLPAIAVPAAAPALPPDQAIARLQRGDPRFRDLRAEPRGGQVRLTGSAASWQDVYDLARALADLPGVERVVFDQIRTPAAGR
jgi:hypothetical protein